MIPSPLPVWTPYGGAFWAAIGDVAAHRADDCAAYSACLARAASESWAGMSCAACSAFSTDQGVHISVMETELLVAAPGPTDETDDLVSNRVTSVNRGDPLPIIVVADEVTEDGRHRVLHGSVILAAAQRLDLRSLLVIRVGRADCPFCRWWSDRPMLVIEPVLKDGYCPACGAYVDWAEDGSLERVEGPRSREHEGIRRRAREAIKPSRGTRVAVAAAAGVVKAIRVAEQLGLLGDDLGEER